MTRPPELIGACYEGVAKAELQAYDGTLSRAYRAGVRAWCDRHLLPCLPA